MTVYYDVQQVCENGHIRNDTIKYRPEANEEYCTLCGKKTITQCPECSTDIRGAMLISKPRGGRPSPCESLTVAPAYCLSCGKPYPWTENKILTAIQMFAEFGNLDDKEKETIEQDIKNIAEDAPQAELSAMRIKRLWEKYSPVARDIIMELASKTIAEILKG